MEGFSQQEYQAVVLAALLHDIGKFLHRGPDKYEVTHEKASLEFINRFSDKLKNDKFYDMELMKLMVCHHHSSKAGALQDAYFDNKLDKEKERVWALLRIVKESDSYSCAERDQSQDRRKGVSRQRFPLTSVFSNINLDVKTKDERPKYGYHLSKLDPATSFPHQIKALNEHEYAELIKEFENAIPDFLSYERFEDILNCWLNLLEKYTWSVPSDTWYENSDVSLYDHLRSTAAFSACMYKRHISSIEKGTNWSRRNEFYLVGGDFSGIQDYIFDITNRGSGGASKRLRARSFFISVFSEVTIHKILHSLDLPFVCNLFSAGGKFLLLAPNIEGVSNILQHVKTEIENEIHRSFFNQFSFLMSWMDIHVCRDELKIYDFFKTADKMFHRLETEKLRKSRNVLIDPETGQWDVSAFKADKMYAQYNGKGDCKICGKGPGICEEGDPDTGGIITTCPICYRDKFDIGSELPKCNYVAFGKGPLGKKKKGKQIVIYSDRLNKGKESEESYYVELLKEYENSEKYYLLYDIGHVHLVCGSNNRKQPLKKYIANHVPLGEDGSVLSFERISEHSKWEKGEKILGSDFLGVLKADIDNLGLIFSKGFENPGRAEKEYDDIDRKTVSRFLTMSRMVELFFSGWIKEIMSKDNKKALINALTEINDIEEKERFQAYLKENVINFNNIYTVYSGGDDMVLVGPWETMIVFSIFLNLKFREFTCNNPFITLSAGLAFVKPKHPIASAIHQAETLLQQSKEKYQKLQQTKTLGKNRITLFGTTIEWDQLPKAINFFLFLNSKLNIEDEDSKINTAFLYRLNVYHQMALNFLNDKKLEGLKYLSSLSYDIGRNIIKWDKDGRIIQGKEEKMALQLLLNEKLDEQSLIYNIKIPLFWALYRNRG